MVLRPNSETSPYFRADFATGFLHELPHMLSRSTSRLANSLSVTNSLAAFRSPSIPRNASATSEARNSQNSDANRSMSMTANHSNAFGFETEQPGIAFQTHSKLRHPLCHQWTFNDFCRLAYQGKTSAASEAPTPGISYGFLQIHSLLGHRLWPQ